MIELYLLVSAVRMAHTVLTICAALVLCQVYWTNGPSTMLMLYTIGLMAEFWVDALVGWINRR